MSWVERTTALTPAGAAGSDLFGASCALSDNGTVLIVGATGADAPGPVSCGGVYTFDWDGSAWVERGSPIFPDSPDTNDDFGRSVALSDDATVLVVGATGWDGAAGSSQGGVYIYDWSGTAWVQRGSVLTPSDAGASDTFGNGVALSDDATVLVVGANQWDGAAGSNQGGVYIYDWSGTAWVQRGSVLTPSDAEASDGFGWSVAVNNDATVLVVGANQWDGAAGNNQGGVYIYDWSGTAWVQRGSVLTPTGALASAQFGLNVAISDDGTVLAVSSYLSAEYPTGSNGSVYVFDWNGSTWVQRAGVLINSDTDTGDVFGYGVALSDDASVLAAGARTWDGPAGSNQGAMYVLDDTSINNSPVLSLPTVSSVDSDSAIPGVTLTFP